MSAINLAKNCCSKERCLMIYIIMAGCFLMFFMSVLVEARPSAVTQEVIDYGKDRDAAAFHIHFRLDQQEDEGDFYVVRSLDEKTFSACLSLSEQRDSLDIYGRFRKAGEAEVMLLRVSRRDLSAQPIAKFKQIGRASCR